MAHPYKPDCPMRVVGCKITCPDLRKWAEKQEVVREAKRKDNILNSFICDNCRKMRRRYEKGQKV